jgi:hypothetical protein
MVSRRKIIYFEPLISNRGYLRLLLFILKAEVWDGKQKDVWK